MASSGIERLQDDDDVTGYDYNRIVDVLDGTRYGQFTNPAPFPTGGFGPFNDSLSYPDSCDATHPFHFDVFIPSNVTQLNFAKLSFFLKAFRSEVAQASSSGFNFITNVTTNAGNAQHAHADPQGGNTGTGGGQDPVIGLNLTFANAITSVGLVYGIFESTTATNVTVTINGTDRTVALGGPAGGFTTDQTELEVSQWLTIGVKNTIDLAPGNLGRIVGHLRLTGRFQSN
jgi:hypothetical protein